MINNNVRHQGAKDVRLAAACVSIILAHCNATSACLRPPEGLVGWWKGENNANDAYGYANHGTADLTYSAGKVGYAFNFVSNGQKVEIQPNPSTNVGVPGQDSANTGSFTLSAWIKTTSTSAQPVFQWDGNGNGCGVHLWIGSETGAYNPKGIHFNVRDTNNSDHFLTIQNQVIQTGTWYLLIAIYDATTRSAYLFLNNSLIGSTTFETTFIPETSSVLRIGHHSNTSGCANGTSGPDWRNWSFKGLIDEPAIFNRALKECELTALYDAGGSGMCAPINELIITNPTLPASAAFQFEVLGPSSHNFTIQRSQDALTWSNVGPGSIGIDSHRTVVTASIAGLANRFFRVKSSVTGKCADFAVGFADRIKPSGKTYILAANHFERGCNTLAELISTVPDGTIANVFTNPNNATTSESTFSSGAWSAPAIKVAPGTPFFLNSSSAISLRMYGYFTSGTNTATLPTSNQFGRASWKPAYGSLANLEITPADTDEIYLWNVTSQSYKAASYVAGVGWLGDFTNPTVALLEGFFYYANPSRNWVQMLNVCP